MATSLLDRAKEFRKDLDTLDKELARLKREYDLYFAGVTARQPFDLKRRVEQLIKKHRASSVGKLELNFRYESLISRYNAMCDYWDKIFKARENLSGAENAFFFMGDLTTLPFRDDFADFIFSLGVLHHLPVPCLEEVRHLRRYAPELLVFLYYSFDNRPLHFRALLSLVTFWRRRLSKVRSRTFRKVFSAAGARFLYLPLVYLGKALEPLGISSHVPLYDFYRDKSVKRIRQDVYDRFFTAIEQRVSRREIMALKEDFSEVLISDHLPYWHFLCRR